MLLQINTSHSKTKSCVRCLKYLAKLQIRHFPFWRYKHSQFSLGHVKVWIWANISARFLFTKRCLTKTRSRHIFQFGNERAIYVRTKDQIHRKLDKKVTKKSLFRHHYTTDFTFSNFSNHYNRSLQFRQILFVSLTQVQQLSSLASNIILKML